MINIVSFCGTKFWYLNEKKHRLDGPAVEWSNGDKEWFVNGQKHRLNGPAFELSSGDKYWYLNGKNYTKTEHKKEMTRRRREKNG